MIPGSDEAAGATVGIPPLGRAGVGLVQAQRLRGHSTPELTAQVYTHLGIDDLRAAVDKIEPPAPRRRAKRGA